MLRIYVALTLNPQQVFMAWHFTFVLCADWGLDMKNKAAHGLRPEPLKTKSQRTVLDTAAAAPKQSIYQAVIFPTLSWAK
jgi:hypothetical protein